jgi:Pectate lyase, N terminus
MPESAEYWQKRAEEAKAEADKMHDAECKEIMLDIAKAYERISDFARQGRQDPKPTKQ